MNVSVNGQEMSVAEGCTVAALLDVLGLDRQHVAVERNLAIVPRAEHPSTALAEGDRLEIVTLVGGG